MKLGMHTYSLYHHGVAEDWAGFELPWGRQMDFFGIMDYALSVGLEGLHVDARALDRLDADYLEKVRLYAVEKDLYLEFNFSLKSGHYDDSVQFEIPDGLTIAKGIGADVAKIGMNLKRPRPIAAGKFHPEMMVQLDRVAGKVTEALPLVEETGIRLALENHTDAFAEEVLYVIDKINHPLVGACIDTVNAIHVTESPIEAVKKLAPVAFTNHFRDNRIVIEPWGLKFVGAAVGEGDLDMKASYALIAENPQVNRINIELDLQCPLDDMDAAMKMEKDAILRSIRYCREVLEIQ